MELFDSKLTDYLDTHTSPEPEVLKALNRETYAHVLMPRMLSGHFQGRVLSMFSHMIAPSQVLEIGTYTGYSAICLAEGLKPGGLVHTIDINEEREEMVNKYIIASENISKIKTYIGNALELIPTMDLVFDLVFIDADKINYSAYFDLVINKVRKGGYIIADNVLWSGKVLDPGTKVDADTKAIMEYNQKIQEDGRVENVLFPIRDGLMVARKL